jgi:hypothetical protein
MLKSDAGTSASLLLGCATGSYFYGPPVSGSQVNVNQLADPLIVSESLTSVLSGIVANNLSPI